MSDSLESRMARVEEAILTLKEDRIEARENRKDILAKLDQLQQTSQSTATIVANLSLEKCGERLNDHDGRIGALEAKTKNLPVIETEIMFWRRVLGGGFHAVWKITLALAGAGGFGAWLSSHFHWGA